MYRLSRLARLIWIVAAFSAMLLPGRVLADEVKPLPPDEKAFGLTLAEWATAWFQWHHSLPVNGHPNADATGIRAGVGQRLPVWFLPSRGSADNRNRTIYVPAGYAILIPGPGLMGWEFPGARSEEALFADQDAEWKRRMETLKGFEVSVDGVPLPDLQRYLVQTPLFTLVLPPTNVLDEPVTAGRDHRMVAFGKGYFFLLPPLSVGKHVIQVKTESVENNTPAQRLSVHNLIIQEANKRIE